MATLNIKNRLSKLEASFGDVSRAVRLVFRRRDEPFDASTSEPRFPGEHVVTVSFVQAVEYTHAR